MLTQTQIEAKYGKANKTGAGYLTVINLPYPMRLAWDKKTVIKKMQCNKLIANRLIDVFKDILAHYGLKQIQDLGIDLYGGCFNYRIMRGGTVLSVHSWGLAIDLDPERNLLKENHTTARFARPEYKPMIESFYKHGFEGLGPERDFDWMHFQTAI